MPKVLKTALIWSVLPVILISILGVGIVSANEETRSNPLLRVGDTWSFHHSKGYNDTISVDRIDHLSNPQSGCFTVETQRETDRTTTEWVSADSTVVQSQVQTSNYTVTDTYSPGLILYEWPLTVGKTWSFRTTVQESYVGAQRASLTTRSFSDERTVKSYANITVTAGRFDTFVVEASVNGQFAVREWFSYSARTAVRADAYLGGQLYDSRELLSYKLAASTAQSAADCPSLSGQLLSSLTSGPWPPYLIMLAVGTMTAGGIAVRRLVRKKSGPMAGGN